MIKLFYQYQLYKSKCVMKKVTVVIVGGGGRGTIYAKHVLEMRDKVEVVAIADPRDYFRNRIGDMFNLPPHRRVNDWRELIAMGKIADAVIIATQDRLHYEPAIAFANQKYHIMIEKPIAPTPEECREIVATANANGVMMAVCHVLRYSNYTRKLKELINDGVVGKVMTVQHLEPVGHWRYAHSYVRGNWRKAEESSTILLAKSIHDLDWISYIVDSECESVSSYGSLMFFTPENRPEGAADRCLECPLEKECAYSAPRFYINRIRQNIKGAYVESVVDNPTEERMLEALKTSPYGRCVFACDNDVVDHQVVNMEFKNGATAVFTLAGCSKYGNRRTTVFGSKGELFGDGDKLFYYNYLNGETRNIEIPAWIPTDNHGGGDYNLLESFTKAIAENDPSYIVTGADVSLKTHIEVFAAEKSRMEKRIVKLSEMLD